MEAGLVVHVMRSRRFADHGPVCIHYLNGNLVRAAGERPEINPGLFKGPVAFMQ